MVLRVYLSSETIERSEIEEDVLRSYVGGVGLGAKFLYDEVPLGTEWCDPENRLIIAGGPLNATSVGGSGSVCVVSKGPLTNGAGSSQANGFFGAYLRLCGLNGIILKGARVMPKGAKYSVYRLASAISSVTTSSNGNVDWQFRHWALRLSAMTNSPPHSGHLTGIGRFQEVKSQAG